MRNSIRAAGLAALSLALTGLPAAAQAPTVPGNPGQPGGSTAARVELPPPPAIRPGEPITLLVFPLQAVAADEAPAAPPAGVGAQADVSRKRAAAEVQDFATAAVKAGFLATPAYSVVSFHSRSPLIQRYRAAQLLSDDDLAGLDGASAINLDRARLLAQRLQIQAVLTGGYDITSNPRNRTAEVGLQAQIVDSVTGQTLRAAAVSGAASGAEGVPQILVERRAIEDAASKLLPNLGIALVAAPAAASVPAARGRRSGSADKAAAAAAKAAREAAKTMEAARKAAAAGDQRSSNQPVETPGRAAAAPGSVTASGGKSRPAGTGSTASSSTTTRQLDAQPAAAPAPSNQGSLFLNDPRGGSARATADAATGAPVPYGYAMQDMKQTPLERKRSNLRVPPWLGLAGFLTGISFLL